MGNDLNEDGFVGQFEDGHERGFGLSLGRASQDQRDMAQEFEQPQADEPVAIAATDDPTLRMRAGAPAGVSGDTAQAAPVWDARQDVRGTDLPAASATSAARNEGGDWDKGSFGEAFRHFRSSGAQDFTWRGKKFTTQLASEARANSPQPSKAAPPAPARPERAQDASADTPDAKEHTPAQTAADSSASLAPRHSDDPDRLARTARVRLADGSTRPAESLAEALAASREDKARRP